MNPLNSSLLTCHWSLSDQRGPIGGMRSLRLASIVGSMRAVGCRCVVVVDVVVVAVSVVVQPTSAITQRLKTAGINFFMRSFYLKRPDRSIPFFFGLGRSPHRT